MKKVFLDSDVLLDASLRRGEFAIPAINILNLVDKGQVHAVTSSVSFVNVHYFLNKYERFKKIELLKEIRSLVSIINVDEKMIDQAIKSGIPDFEDAVQYYAAVSTGIDVIITRNIKDYKQATIPVLTPIEFLNTL